MVPLVARYETVDDAAVKVPETTNGFPVPDKAKVVLDALTVPAVIVKTLVVVESSISVQPPLALLNVTL